ncbi:MAG: hypothetical protein Q9167_000584 [Letrouitia subvulpina]
MAGNLHESNIDGVNGFIDEDSSSPVVLKFGGTSIGKYLPEVEPPIGLSTYRTTIEAFLTESSLLRAYHEAAQRNIDAYQDLCSNLEKEHYEAGKCIVSYNIRDRYFQAIKLEFSALESYLSSITQLTKTDPVLEDAVVSAGEKLSCQLLDAVLADNGIQSSYIDLSNHSVVAIVICAPLSSLLVSKPVNCSKCLQKIAELICSGGSRVWKEVDGVFTADPRYVPTAQLLPSITPDEVNELTYYGSEVIHQFTVEHCVPTIPIRIKNVLRPENEGTIIQTSSQGLRDGYKNPNYGQLKLKRPTAVTVKRSITVVNVHSNRKGTVMR